MQSIGYGIIIAVLMGLSAFASALVVLKLKTTPTWRPFNMLNSKEDDERVEAEIQKGFDYTNIENPPPTADGVGRRFKRTHSEELTRGTRT